MTKEIERLEKLWSGEFGNAYTKRNRPDIRRLAFWKKILSETKSKTVLEVGCNLGGNLRKIADCLPNKNIYGVDINPYALEVLKRDCPGINAIWSQARQLVFRDKFFDMVFTAGVLIHQPESALKKVMGEVVRCSKRWVLCLEYFSSDTKEVFYRGHAGALFKRDYGKLYSQWFPELKLKKTGFLSKKQGWDDITYWLFSKKGRP